MTPGIIVAAAASPILVILAALLAVGETAILAVPSARLQQLELDGNAKAQLIRRLRDDKAMTIGALQITGYLLKLSAVALGTVALTIPFGVPGAIYAAVTATLVIVVFAEMLPKSFAVADADIVALRVVPLVDSLVRLLRPLVVGLQFVAQALLRLFGRRSVATQRYVEELRGAIEQHRGEEREVRDERRMLRSVLDLAEVWVGEVMTHRRNMTAIDISLPPREIVEQVLNNPNTRIPLWADEPDNIVGVLHAKVLWRAVRTAPDLDALDVRSIAGPAWFVPDSTTLLDQLRAFRKRREHFALVVDEYGALMGLVTLEDIIEEIVGDISDEHDVPVPGVRPQGDGSFVVAGTVTIRDLNRDYEWNLPDEEATTVAGLLLREARQIPEAGQIFDFYGFRFSVLRRVRNQITSIRIKPPRKERSSA